MLLLTFRVRVDLLDEMGLRLIICRVRSQSISSLISFLVVNAVTASAHLTVHTRRSDFLLEHSLEHSRPPAVRRLAFEAAHKPLTITEHPLTRPLVLGSPTVITLGGPAPFRLLRIFLGRRWIASTCRRYTHGLAADQCTHA